MNIDVAKENGRQRHPRTYLFVPGNRPDRFDKAIGSGADRTIIDLEDAVAPGEKEQARSAASNWLQKGNSAVLRINGPDSFWFDGDLAVAARTRSAEIMLPKADLGSLQRVIHFLVDRPVVALVETVMGLMQVDEIARMRGVSRVAFGNIDFTTDAGLPVSSGALDHARFRIAMASRAAGLPAPIDGVTTALDDEGILLTDLQRAREYGFAGKLCIHPKQVGLANSFLLPGDEEKAWAERILEAVEKAGEGVIQFEGKMVDKPVIERARSIIAAYT